MHLCCFFFFNDTATTEIYTLSLHDALPISAVVSMSTGFTAARGSTYQASRGASTSRNVPRPSRTREIGEAVRRIRLLQRSEEHTSELQSQSNIVCRLLLEKKKIRYRQ